MDAMNAIVLLDPRMDTGCLPGPSEGEIDGFDLWERLLPEEVCAIMDKLTACEVGQRHGSSCRHWRHGGLDILT